MPRPANNQTGSDQKVAGLFPYGRPSTVTFTEAAAGFRTFERGLLCLSD